MLHLPCATPQDVSDGHQPFPQLSQQKSSCWHLHMTHTGEPMSCQPLGSIHCNSTAANISFTSLILWSRQLAPHTQQHTPVLSNKVLLTSSLGRKARLSKEVTGFMFKNPSSLLSSARKLIWIILPSILPTAEPSSPQQV